MTLVVKNRPAHAGDARDTASGLRRSPGGGSGNPLQYSCLGEPMDRVAWQSTVHGIAKSWAWLSTQAQRQWTAEHNFFQKGPPVILSWLPLKIPPTTKTIFIALSVMNIQCPPGRISWIEEISMLVFCTVETLLNNCFSKSFWACSPKRVHYSVLLRSHGIWIHPCSSS